jgi:hypothetical protein
MAITFAHAALLAASVYAALAIAGRQPFLAKPGPVEMAFVKLTEILMHPMAWLLPAQPEAPPPGALFFLGLAINSLSWGLALAALLQLFARAGERGRGQS